MFKKSLSFLLAVISLFTLVMPVCAYAEAEESESENVSTFIKIQDKDAWGDFGGKWYYKTWTGEAVSPKIEISQTYSKEVDGKWVNQSKVLVEEKDYVKSFGNNRDMGYCRLNVVGKGDYSDTDVVGAARDTAYSVLDYWTEEDFLITKEEGFFKGPIFVIRPLGTKLNKVTPQKKAVRVTWKKQARKMSVKRITGYQIQLSTRKDFQDDNRKTVTVKGYKNTSKTIKKLKGKKNYYVRIRTFFDCKDGFRSYSTWSKAKTFTTKK